MSAHARLSPSSASRWMACPGSVALCERVKVPESSFESDEGTAAHQVFEICLRTGLDPWTFVGQKVRVGERVFEFTDQWAFHMEPILDRIYAFGGKMFAEKRVTLDRWMKKQFGTLDCGIIDAKIGSKKYIVITDLKWGLGVPVEVRNNYQTMIYGLGFWDNIARHETKTERFLMRIEQPRIAGVSGDWEVSLDDLLKFGEKLRKAAIRTYQANAPREPGTTQCMFCPAKASCPEFRSWVEELTGIDFDELDTRTVGMKPSIPRNLTPLQRSQTIIAAPMIRKWFDRLESECIADYMAGRSVPLLKLVEGRKGHRNWTDTDAVKRMAAVFAPGQEYNLELKTPAQLEPLLLPEEYKALTNFIRQEDGRPKLAPNESKRAAVVTTASMFKPLELEDE